MTAHPGSTLSSSVVECSSENVDYCSCQKKQNKTKKKQKQKKGNKKKRKKRYAYNLLVNNFQTIPLN